MMQHEIHELSLSKRMSSPAREPSAAARAAAPFLVALAGLDEARAAGAALNGEGTYGSWVGWTR